MKYLLITTLLCYSGLTQAQDNPAISSKLQQLTEERQRLYNNWKEASNQSSGLFGSKSKDDLRVEIDDLKKIVSKDNDILDELESLRHKEKGQMLSQYNELTTQYNDLRNENLELKKRIAEHQSWSKENHSILERTENKQTLFLSLFALTLVACVVLLVKYLELRAEVKRK